MRIGLGQDPRFDADTVGAPDKPESTIKNSSRESEVPEQDFEKMPLTPYDEYPSPTPYPMSYVPNTDFAWDDGSLFMIYKIDAGIPRWNGMRINPNSNIAGAHT